MLIIINIFFNKLKLQHDVRNVYTKEGLFLTIQCFHKVVCITLGITQKHRPCKRVFKANIKQGFCGWALKRARCSYKEFPFCKWDVFRKHQSLPFC